MSVERQTLSGLKWVAGAKFSSQLLSWAATLLVMRLLMPADYGLMAIVAVITSVLSNVSELGIGASVIQSREISREDLAKINGLITSVNVAIFFLICIAAPVIASFYEMPPLRLLIQVASSQFLITSIAILPQAVAQREFQFKWLAAVEISWVLGTSVSTLLLAWFGAGVWALVIGNIIGAITRTLMFSLHGIVKPSFRLAGTRKFLAVGGAVMFGRLAWQLVYQSDVAIGARRIGATDIGTYSVAQQLATMPMQRITGVLNQVVLPAIARLQNETERLRIRLLQGTRLLTTISIPILWGISAVAPELVDIVLGEKWRDAIYPVQILSLVAPLRMVSGVYNTAGIGVGRAALDFQNNAITAIVLPSAFFIGSRYGLHGLAVSWVVAIPLVFALTFPRVGRVLSTTTIDVAKFVWRPVVAGVAMYSAVLGARSFVLDTADFPRLLALIAAGAIGYCGVLYALDRRIVHDMLGLLRSETR